MLVGLSFCLFYAGLFFFSGASSVFINREDTSVSVAVMHTGRALMKTDALSVEAVAGGGGRGGGGSSQPAWPVLYSMGEP